MKGESVAGAFCDIFLQGALFFYLKKSWVCSCHTVQSGLHVLVKCCHNFEV